MGSANPAAAYWIALLENPATRSAVRRLHTALFNEFFFDQREAPDGDGQTRPIYQHETLIERLETESRPSGMLFQILKESVFDRAAAPAIATIDELLEQLCLVIRVLPKDFDAGYSLFIGNVNWGIIKSNESAPFPICRAIPQTFAVVEGQVETGNDLPKWYDEKIVLWSGNDIDLEIEGLGPAIKGPTHLKRVFARIVGVMSDNVSVQLSSDLSRLVPSILRSFSPRSTSDVVGLPLVNQSEFIELLPDLRVCLACYFPLVGTDEDWNHRIRNAVTLLVEADQQSHAAVGLTLIMASMEAMLCAKGSGITKALTQRAARLLEPADELRSAAEDKIRDLYGIRCKVIHGSSLVAQDRAREESRFLAGCTLRRMIEWARADAANAFATDAKITGLVPRFFSILDGAEATKWTASLDLSPAVELWRVGKPR